jgi:hypothetical protein
MLASFQKAVTLVDEPEVAYQHFKEATAGSTVIPVLAAWLHALGRQAAVESLSNLVAAKLQHSTLQLWIPDEGSESHLYIDDHSHGRALCGLPVAEGGAELLETIAAACRTYTASRGLSAVATGFWPIVLVACRHHQLPVPPNFWIAVLVPPEAAAAGQSVVES